MARRTLSSIQVGAEADWSGAPYLSIDIDRAHGDVLLDTIDLVEEYRVPVTWFYIRGGKKALGTPVQIIESTNDV